MSRRFRTPSSRSGIRLDPELTQRLERFEGRTGVSAVTLGRNAMAAALDYFEAKGKISLPLHVVDDDIHGLNEKGTGYKAEQGKKLRCAAARTQFFSVQRNVAVPKPG